MVVGVTVVVKATVVVGTTVEVGATVVVEATVVVDTLVVASRWVVVGALVPSTAEVVFGAVVAETAVGLGEPSTAEGCAVTSVSLRSLSGLHAAAGTHTASRTAPEASVARHRDFTSWVFRAFPYTWTSQPLTLSQPESATRRSQ